MNGSFGCTTARTADVVDDKKSSDKTKNLAKMQRKQVVLFIIDLMCDKRRPVLVNERKHPNGTVCAIRKESISRVRNEPIRDFHGILFLFLFWYRAGLFGIYFYFTVSIVCTVYNPYNMRHSCSASSSVLLVFLQCRLAYTILRP